MKREISFTTGEYRDRINDIRRLQSLTSNEAYLATPGGFEKPMTFERSYFFKIENPCRRASDCKTVQSVYFLNSMRKFFILLK